MMRQGISDEQQFRRSEASADRKISEESAGLGTKAAYGFIWTFGEKVLANGVSFMVSLMLARLLSPEDYGIVAVTAVFIHISNALVEGGFGSALIQKKDADELDFHTVFLFEMAVSSVLYLLLVLTAKKIAVFYETPEISSVLKILGLSLFFGSIRNVQHAYVSRQMDFRKFFIATLSGTVVSGAAGAALAVLGFGVWALVVQQLLNSLMDAALLFFRIQWKPKLHFSFQRLKHLSSYGWKICAAGLLSTVYADLYGLLIGKVFSKELLAVFNKGNAFPALVTNNVSGPINAVTFPALALCQDDRIHLQQMTRKTLIVTSYLLWPVLVGMAASAAPMVELLLTRKWADCVIFLRISAAAGLFWPLSAANGQLINAVGRSDLSLRLDVLKKIVGILLICCTIPFGIVLLAWGRAAGQLFAAACDMYPNRKLISYGYLAQLKDLLPNIFANGCLYLCMRLISWLALPISLSFLFQVLIGVFTYLFCSYLFRLEGFSYVRHQWKQLRKQRISIRRNHHDF